MDNLENLAVGSKMGTAFFGSSGTRACRFHPLAVGHLDGRRLVQRQNRRSGCLGLSHAGGGQRCPAASPSPGNSHHPEAIAPIHGLGYFQDYP